MSQKRKMIITGVSGLLGNNLAWRLRDRWDIVGLYHSHPVRIDGIETRGLDLLDEDGVARLFSETAPDTVVHCAAMTNVDQCENESDLCRQVNIDATRHVAEHTPENAALVYISTDAVYSGEGSYYVESGPVAPPNVYGQSKYEGEIVAAAHPRAVLLRTNLFGWNIQDKNSLGEMVLGVLLASQTMRGFRDSIVSTMYTFLLADLIERVVRKGLTGVYNCGSSTAISKYDFACRIADELELDKGLIEPISMDEFTLVAKRGKNLSMNVDKLAADLGVSIATAEDSVKAFCDDYRAGIPDSIKGQG